MRILLISDSHGNNEAVDELIVKWPDIDIYLHAGDSECHPRSIYPFRVVRGNCDYSFDMQDELLIPSPFGNILVRHKKEISQKRLEQDDIKVFIYGHTHVPECARRKGVAFINPGSLAYPRSEYGMTYMILDINEEEIEVKLYSYETGDILKRYRVKMGNPSEVDKEEEPVEQETKEENEELFEETNPENEVNVEEKDEVQNKDEEMDSKDEDMTSEDDEELAELERQLAQVEKELEEIRSKKKQ